MENQATLNFDDKVYQLNDLDDDCKQLVQKIATLDNEIKRLELSLEALVKFRQPLIDELRDKLPNS